MAPTVPPGARSPGDVLGRRIGAALLDIAVLVLALSAASLLSGAGQTASGGGVTLTQGGTIAYSLVGLAYYFAAEAITGQTLGKRVVGIRVCSASGGPAGVRAVALRTLLRLVDALPLLYALGLLVALSTRRRQRLGDLVAQTVVIGA
ncbi:MAG TPA: RDD family protein [Solirubrobacteraceae bacterium]|jgi:uncharacterized RDD family membrane protein YckC|nr:RDD family protein [Solirubrobacteraceae bacterium]